MISYELALQLKNAGFPQKPEIGSMYWTDGFLSAAGHGSYFTDNPENWPLKCPTLSELIEACGDSFEELQRKRDRLTGIIKFKVFGMIADESNPNIYGEGSTPEEAVARLYISLYSKDNEKN